uniref:Uncharacterized protein n=1 Tax=Moniliophthora roreri TaxID=221103 RepID=A0A0W0F2F5_MONRR
MPATPRDTDVFAVEDPCLGLIKPRVGSLLIDTLTLLKIRLPLKFPDTSGKHVTSHLRSLELCYIRESWVFLPIPVATSSHLSYSISPADDVPLVFLEYLKRYRPPIVDLTFDGVIFTPGDFIWILKPFPSISILCIQDSTLCSYRQVVADDSVQELSLLENSLDFCCQYCSSALPTKPNSLISRIIEYIQQKPVNYVAPDHEIPIAEALTREAEDELSACHVVLDGLRSPCRRLERRRAALWTLKQRLHGMVRPSIRWLPPELLLRVFLMCENPELGAEAAQPTAETVLLLSHVCSGWRGLAFSQSILWTNIRICFGDRGHATDRIHAFTKFCLEKSRTRPLNIFFDTHRRSFLTPPPPPHHPLLFEVLKHSARWRDVTLNIQGTDVVPLPDALPVLESLRIRRPMISILATSRQELVSGTHSISTPSLRQLETRVGVEGHSRILTRLDTRNLVRLSTSESHIGIILDVMRTTPALLELSLLSLLYLPRGTPIPNYMVTSHLHSLNMQYIAASGVFFEHVTLPSLMSLQISRPTSDRDDVLSILIQFIQRSRPPLAVLIIEDVSFITEGLFNVMNLLPSVSTLRLCDSATGHPDRQVINRTMIRGLTISPGSPEAILLPNLANIELYATFSTFNDVELLEMVRSRRVGMAGVKRIQSFKLQCRRRDLSDRTREQLESLKDIGLMVNITHGGMENRF